MSKYSAIGAQSKNIKTNKHEDLRYGGPKAQEYTFPGITTPYTQENHNMEKINSQDRHIKSYIIRKTLRN